MLLSAKAGGVGLNLVGANHLLLFDIDWNPSVCLQGKFILLGINRSNGSHLERRSKERSPHLSDLGVSNIYE